MRGGEGYTGGWKGDARNQGQDCPETADPPPQRIGSEIKISRVKLSRSWVDSPPLPHPDKKKKKVKITLSIIAQNFSL